VRPKCKYIRLLDRCIALLVEHKLTTETASMIKYSATDMCGKVDECLQLFGGYGYMWIIQFQEC
jgi:acyl-CoA dehydrogenase